MKKIFFLGFLLCLTSLIADENKSFKGSVPEKKLHKEHHTRSIYKRMSIKDQKYSR